MTEGSGVMDSIYFISLLLCIWCFVFFKKDVVGSRGMISFSCPRWYALGDEKFSGLWGEIALYLRAAEHVELWEALGAQVKSEMFRKSGALEAA